MILKIIYILLLFIIISVLLFINYNFDIIYRKKSINGFCKDQKELHLKKKGVFSDKYLVKKYIEDNFPEIKVIKTLFITKDPDDLNNFNFPDNFLLKCTSGSQMNIIVKNNNFDIEDLIKKSKIFMKRNYSNYSYRKIPFLNLKEKQYDYCDKSIMIEEFIGDNLKDYKFFIVKGKLSFIQIDKNRFNGHERNFYDRDLNLINSKSLFINNFSEKIEVENSIVKKIEKIGEKFYTKEKIDFFRLDVYIVNNDIYFGEFTFTPGNCCERFEKKLDDKIYNEYIDI